MSAEHSELPPVEFREHDTPTGARVGAARLSRARQLNALTREMCALMLERFREWASDESIACVVLDGAGDKGFCAGGDVATAVRSIRAGGARRYVYGDALLADEYRLVRMIAEYPKPFMSWAHGATMGAGAGLAVAAAERVVSDGLKLAMPEIQIGLFPDVGSAWFLNRVPGDAGVVVALTGLVLNDADVLFAGLADYSIAFDRRDSVHEALCLVRWTGDARDDRRQLRAVLARAASAPASTSALREHLPGLTRVARAHDAAALFEALAAEAQQDPWFEPLRRNLESGSPIAAHVAFEHLRRSRTMSLADVLRVDLMLARARTRHPDFAEGVRALLIDKDRRPAWSPAALSEVAVADVERHFVPI